MAVLIATVKLVSNHTLLVSNILLVSSFIALLVIPCNAENVSVSRVCIGETHTLECSVEGSATSTVWKGMIFDCSSSNDELVLIPRTNSSTNKTCNDGDIRAMITDKDGVIFESRLDLTLTSKYLALSEEELTVQCIFDNGTGTEVVASYSLFLEDCSTNSNEDQNNNVLEGKPLRPSLELPQYLGESGSVNLSWTANVTEGVDHNYTIVIHNVTSTSQEVLVESTTSLHYMFDKCGEFDIQVIAVNGAGQSAPSNTVRVSLPLLPDITPVSQSLKHRVWKVEGRIMLLITFEPPHFCAEQRVTTYCVQMNTILFKCVDASEIEVHLGAENGLADNTLYEYTISAVNKLGVSTSTTRNLTTSDIESVIARMITEHVIEVHCYFITGSDANGCMVVIVSKLPSVSNITVTLIKTNQSDTVVNELFNISANTDCYHCVFAFDIEANSSISSLAIGGELSSNTTNKCIDDTNASNSVAITWSVIGVVSLLIIGIISISFVTIMLSRFHAKRKADPQARQNTDKEEDIVTTPSDAYGVIHRST